MRGQSRGCRCPSIIRFAPRLSVSQTGRSLAWSCGQAWFDPKLQQVCPGSYRSTGVMSPPLPDGYSSPLRPLPRSPLPGRMVLNRGANLSRIPRPSLTACLTPSSRTARKGAATVGPPSVPDPKSRPLSGRRRCRICAGYQRASPNAPTIPTRRIAPPKPYPLGAPTSHCRCGGHLRGAAGGMVGGAGTSIGVDRPPVSRAFTLGWADGGPPCGKASGGAGRPRHRAVGRLARCTSRSGGRC